MKENKAKSRGRWHNLSLCQIGEHKRLWPFHWPTTSQLVAFLIPPLSETHRSRFLPGKRRRCEPLWKEGDPLFLSQPNRPTLA